MHKLILGVAAAGGLLWWLSRSSSPTGTTPAPQLCPPGWSYSKNRPGLMIPTPPLWIRRASDGVGYCTVLSQVKPPNA